MRRFMNGIGPSAGRAIRLHAARAWAPVDRCPALPILEKPVLGGSLYRGGLPLSDVREPGVLAREPDPPGYRTFLPYTGGGHKAIRPGGSGRESGPPVERHNSRAGDPIVRRSRILVVDDDPNMLLLIQYNLEKRGHAVATASHGQVGLDLALGNHFDLVILDLMIPGQSGLEICRQLRQLDRYSKTPILLVTARSQMEDFDRAAEHGVTDYVTKPFDPLRFAEQVDEHLHVSSGTSE